MLIALSSFNNDGRAKLNSAYVDAFTFPGVNPIIIPCIKPDADELSYVNDQQLIDYTSEIAERADVLVLTGGGDINPVSFGEINCISSNTAHLRDANEMLLAQKFIAKKKPIMGICRGFQLLFKMLSQDPDFFTQHIKEDETHSLSEVGRNEFCHTVKILKGFREHFSRVFKKDVSKIPVNSFHHQGVNLFEHGKKAKTPQILDSQVLKFEAITGVSVLAHTGMLCEAFEKDNIFGVQWHPEEFKGRTTISYFLDRIKG